MQHGHPTLGKESGVKETPGVYIFAPTLRYPHCDKPLSPNRPFVMGFTIERANKETAIVHFGQTLDFRNTDDFKAVSHAGVEAGIRGFVLDFAATGLLDSTGLGAIFSLHRKVSSVDGRIVFAAPSYPVLTIMQMVNVLKIFPVFKTVEEAVTALTEQPTERAPDRAPEAAT